MRTPQKLRATSLGFTVLDLLVVVTVTGILAMLTVPPLLGLSSRLRAEMAASELAGTLRQARTWAILNNSKVAVRFDTDGEGRVSFSLYKDGDGDGVLSRDIASGVDPLAQDPRTLGHLGHGVDFGFPPGIRPRDPGDPRRRLTRLDDPIRFNRSDMASFDPFGTATPGSLYLTDHRRNLYAVRVSNRVGRIRVLRWDPEEDRWRSR